MTHDRGLAALKDRQLRVNVADVEHRDRARRLTDDVVEQVEVRQRADAHDLGVDARRLERLDEALKERALHIRDEHGAVAVRPRVHELPVPYDLVEVHGEGLFELKGQRLLDLLWRRERKLERERRDKVGGERAVDGVEQGAPLLEQAVGGGRDLSERRALTLGHDRLHRRSDELELLEGRDELTDLDRVCPEVESYDLRTHHSSR